MQHGWQCLLLHGTETQQKAEEARVRHSGSAAFCSRNSSVVLRGAHRSEQWRSATPVGIPIRTAPSVRSHGRCQMRFRGGKQRIPEKWVPREEGNAAVESALPPQRGHSERVGGASRSAKAPNGFLHDNGPQCWLPREALPRFPRRCRHFKEHGRMEKRLLSGSACRRLIVARQRRTPCWAVATPAMLRRVAGLRFARAIWGERGVRQLACRCDS